jgi:hypothetical protein
MVRLGSEWSSCGIKDIRQRICAQFASLAVATRGARGGEKNLTGRVQGKQAAHKDVVERTLVRSGGVNFALGNSRLVETRLRSRAGQQAAANGSFLSGKTAGTIGMIPTTINGSAGCGSGH